MFFQYMIEATEEILSLMIMLGMILAYARHAYLKPGRMTVRLGVLAGIGLAVWMAIMKNATNKISTSISNRRIYTISFISLAVFIVFTAIELVLYTKKNISLKISAACIALSVYTAMLLFAVLPGFIAYPYSLKVAETTVFSTSYVIKLCGVITAFVLTLVAAFASNRMGRSLGKGGSFIFMVIMMAITGVQQYGALMQAMINSHVLSTSQVPFKMVVYINNHDNLFTFLIIAAACAAAVVMLIRSAHVNEPYSNPAQHRKIRAKWILIRKWAATGLVTAFCAVILMTAVDSVVNAEVQLSPTEDATIEDGNAVVTFEQVSDGHLHRYGYTTPNGVEVRFIVIQKPNSNLYGVGMDCCDICGETGYYENGSGDVVCNRCDVIMNINTIGFQGGCNPKVVEYTVEDGKIIIPVEQLEQYEKDFS